MPGGFVDHVLELLAGAGPVRARSMMGGHMIHLGALAIALVHDDRLYLKIDAETQGAFASAGCEPFTYERGRRVIAMSFWSAPDAALDDPEAMAPWARLAHEAAVRSRRPRRKAARARRAGGGAKVPPEASAPPGRRTRAARRGPPPRKR